MITFPFPEKEELMAVSIQIPSSFGKWVGCDHGQISFSPSDKGKGVVVVVIMAIYPHSSFPTGKDWRSDPYRLLPLLGKGVVVIMARYLVSLLTRGGWWWWSWPYTTPSSSGEGKWWW